VVTSGEFRCLGQETMAIELFLHCNVKIWLRWETRAPDAGAFRRAMKGEIDFGEPAKIQFVYLGEVKIQPPFLEADGFRLEENQYPSIKPLRTVKYANFGVPSSSNIPALALGSPIANSYHEDWSVDPQKLIISHTSLRTHVRTTSSYISACWIIFSCSEPVIGL